MTDRPVLWTDPDTGQPFEYRDRQWVPAMLHPADFHDRGLTCSDDECAVCRPMDEPAPHLESDGTWTDNVQGRIYPGYPDDSLALLTGVGVALLLLFALVVFAVLVTAYILGAP